VPSLYKVVRPVQKFTHAEHLWGVPPHPSPLKVAVEIINEILDYLGLSPKDVLVMGYNVL